MRIIFFNSLSLGLLATLVSIGISNDLFAANPPSIISTQNRTESSMQLVIINKKYEVQLDSNATARDIAARLPLQLTLHRYGGHEYYADLPFRPAAAKERTTLLQAGHLYYWPGGNAFVVNFKAFDTAPYEEVHLGEITDPAVSDILQKSGASVSVEIR
jgi:hypothetical protein